MLLLEKTRVINIFIMPCIYVLQLRLFTLTSNKLMHPLITLKDKQ